MTYESNSIGVKRALIISVSSYDHLEKLPFCDNDGNAVYELLTKKLGYIIKDNHKLIGRVDYWDMRDTINNFFNDNDISSSDTLLFYFSGHGVPDDDGEHYFASSQFDPDNPSFRGLSYKEYTTSMSNCRSKIIFSILDCCYSGAATISKGDDNDTTKIGKRIIEKKYQQGEGKCILASCKPMQKAYFLEEEGHSLFTHYLLQGLQGADGKCIDEEGHVTPERLQNYIYYKIDSLKDRKKRQLPFLKCEYTGKIILSRLQLQPRPEPIPRPEPGPRPSPFSKRILSLISVAAAVVVITGIIFWIVIPDGQEFPGNDYGDDKTIGYPSPLNKSRYIDVNEDAKNTIINLDSYFIDSENQTKLEYAVSGNSNPSLVEGMVEGTNLILSYFPDQSGLAKINVTAKDFSSRSVESTFRIKVNPINDKPIVTIVQPRNNSVFNEREEIFFSADASDSDLKDGDISKSIKWNSSINGEIGEGPRIYHSLSLGEHLISATTKDKAGVKAVSKILMKVNALDKPPVINSINLDPPLPKSGNKVILSAEITDEVKDVQNELKYEWKQIEGPKININNAYTNVPSFIAPKVTQISSVDIILIVTDKSDNSDSFSKSFNIYP